jgi:hypothetical protein
MLDAKTNSATATWRTTRWETIYNAVYREYQIHLLFEKVTRALTCAEVAYGGDMRRAGWSPTASRRKEQII